VWLAGVFLQLSGSSGIKLKREQLSEFSIVAATRLDSETIWFYLKRSEGYLQSKDLQSKFFSQFLVFRLRCPKTARVRKPPQPAMNKTEGHTVARRMSAKRDVIPNRPERAVRNLLFVAALPPSLPTGIFPMWKSSGNPVGRKR
jgi:hypothetical protein